MPSFSTYIDLTLVLLPIFLINVSFIFRDKSCSGSLSFSVVRARERNPVLDKNTKSSPIACILSLDTRPTPLTVSYTHLTLPTIYSV